MLYEHKVIPSYDFKLPSFSEDVASCRGITAYDSSNFGDFVVGMSVIELWFYICVCLFD